MLRGSEPIDLLFTDIIMPGYTENAIDPEGRRDHSVQLLRKPYRRSDLANMILAALMGRGVSFLRESA